MRNIYRTQYKKVLFNLHKELFKEVKTRSAKKNISMRIWLTRAIVEYIKQEDKYSIK